MSNARHHIFTVALWLSCTVRGFATFFTVDATNLVSEINLQNFAILNSETPISLNSGVVAIGTFTDGFSFETATQAELLNDFNQFSSSRDFRNGSDLDGFFESSFSANVTSEDSFDGKPIHLVLGNGPTLQNSTRFIVAKSNSSIFEDNGQPIGGTSLLLDPANAEILVGMETGDVDIEEFTFSSLSTQSLPVLSGFSAWASEQGLTGLPNDDFDSDNLDDLTEYALGTNPKSPSPDIGIITAGSLSFPKGAEARNAGDVTMNIQTSTTLQADSWQIVTPTIDTDDLLGIAIDSSDTERFYRLQVNLVTLAQ